jgi:hypothetical protein
MASPTASNLPASPQVKGVYDEVSSENLAGCLPVLCRCPLVPGGALTVMADGFDGERDASLMLLGGPIVSGRGVQQCLSASLISLMGVEAGTSAGGGLAQLLQADADLREALRDLGGSLVLLAGFDGSTFGVFVSRHRGSLRLG